MYYLQAYNKYNVKFKLMNQAVESWAEGMISFLVSYFKVGYCSLIESSHD